MARYEIEKASWHEANSGTIGGPTFRVNLEGSTDPPFWIGLHCEKWRLEQLEDKLPKVQRELWSQRLRGAVWRYAVEVLENALAQDAIDLSAIILN